MSDETALAVREAGTVDVHALIAQAIEKGTNIDVMERLFAMAREWKAMAARDAYFKALAEFQAACPTIGKTASVAYEGRSGTVAYKYAPLDVIVSVVRDPLRAHGFSYTVTTQQTETTVTAICHAHHEGGHTEDTSFTIPIDATAKMNGAQKTASALTYAKRYAFCNAFGLLTGDEDNDGRGTDPAKAEGANGATGEAPETRPAQERPAPPACPKCGKPLHEYKKGGYYCPEKKGGCGAGWDKDEWATELAVAAGKHGENMEVGDDYIEVDENPVTGEIGPAHSPPPPATRKELVAMISSAILAAGDLILDMEREMYCQSIKDAKGTDALMVVLDEVQRVVALRKA